MNVVWIMADHYRADAIGALGHPVVKTPHLDSLAGRSSLFENAFAQSPLCCPSRASFFTSCYVHKHGVWWNGIPWQEGMLTLPALLRRNGYRTGIVGKQHFYPQDRDYGFDHRELHEEHLPPELSAYEAFLRGRKPGLKPIQSTTWDNTRPKSSELGVCNMPEEQEETMWVASQAGEFIRQNAGENFFLYASFIRPHCPWNPLARFLDLYRNSKIDPPVFDRREWDRLPPRVAANARTWGWDQLGPDDFREIRRHYYALCSQVDEGVGRILNAIEQAGLADQTIVVFSSDHGEFIGEHGTMHKMHLWDGSLHVPLILRDPRCRGGIRCGQLVETIDVMPTLLDLLGIDKPACLQGRSFASAMQDLKYSHKDAVFAEYAHHTVVKDFQQLYDACRDLNSVSIRTDRWKLIHYADEPGELYDIVHDPGERNNLWHATEMKDIRHGLVERLLNWRIQMESAGYSQPDSINRFFRHYFAAQNSQRGQESEL